ncbi:MAG TPA: molybdopterin-guanine dinucleotide biosynthesis protein B [Steroidobacteraceae bacterium]|nr:molybdopterin-guanine dinucleotide biosynthesis protein B [Gammaproteobacteria bacterium]HEV2286338.1 molybdopterin-guanine dinucleotide biosynthesis protein B [Steroidobacteraceae bacterium]
MSGTRVLGIAGWSGSGKTTLIARLIPLLTARGLTVAAVKHAHHSFEVDHPGKDSYQFRAAGASEVLVSSARRWVQMHELGDGESEETLAGLLRRVSPCDLVLIEGFKRERHPKLEVFRRSLGFTPLYAADPRVVAVASDEPLPQARIPVVALDDVSAIAALVCERAVPLAAALRMLAREAPLRPRPAAAARRSAAARPARRAPRRT